MEKRIKRKIGALAILGMLAVIALSTSVIADLDNYIWYRDDVNNDVTLSSNATGYKVGIGRSDPVRKLDVLDTSNPQLRLSVSDTYFSDLQTTSSGYLYINPSHGRVGIGVNDPAETLEIDGNILLNTGADRSISVEQLLANNDGYKLTISSGDAYYLSGALGYTGGDLVLHAGDGAGPGVEIPAGGGDVYIYGGAEDGVAGVDGNVFLAHTGTVAQGNVGIGTTSPGGKLGILAPYNQLVLSYDSTHYTIFSVRESGYLSITPSHGRVGIGSSLPDHRLHIFEGGYGDATVKIDVYGSGYDSGIRLAESGTDKWFIYNDGSDSDKLKIASDGGLASETRFTIQQDGNVGIGTASPAASLHVDQSSTTGAKPVLTVDQADVSEEFIRFIGTSADTVLTQSIVENADVTTPTPQGWLKVYVQDDGNQLTDQAYFVPIYTLA